MFFRLRWGLTGLFLLGLIACKPSDEEISLKIESLLGGLGLRTNIFDVEPENQLGTIVFYRSPEVIERLIREFDYRGETSVVIQIQGKLAVQIQEKISYFSKGTIRASESQEVVYLFGEIAEDTLKDLENLYTVDDIHYLEEKDMVIVGGAEALTLLDIAEERFGHYFSDRPQKISRVFYTSKENAVSWTRDFFYTLYEDLSLTFISNPLTVLKTPPDIGAFAIEGVGQVVLNVGNVWVISFDSLSRCLAYLTGAELIPESVLIKKTVKWVADVGYQTFYTVASILDYASENKLREDHKLRGILVHPWISFNVASVALQETTNTVELARSGLTDIVVGYIADSVELLGEFLNLFHRNLVGDFFIFVGEELGSSITLTSLVLKSVIRFSGGGLSAIVGTFAWDVPWRAKEIQFKTVWEHVKEDLKAVWHEFLKLIGLR